MRFMIIIKADASSEAGILPDSDMLVAMGRFNEELIDAGVLLAAEGLHASAKGARVRREGGRHVVTDGPFAETKELIAGFWLVEVKNKDEAIAWVKKIPLGEGEEVEIRQVHEVADFPEDEVSAGHLRREEEFRAATQRPLTR